MGSISSTIQDFFAAKKPKVLFVGLNDAGKTTILYTLIMGEAINNAISTIGFNVEPFNFNNIKMIMWDVNGSYLSRPFYQNCMLDVSALIFVVDSANRELLDEASFELKIFLEKDVLRNAILLVLANKQDLPGALNAIQLAEKLDLNDIIERPWQIQEASAFTGYGLKEGLAWLTNELSKRS